MTKNNPETELKLPPVISVLHHLGFLSPPEEIQALIDELSAKDSEAYKGDIESLKLLLAESEEWRKEFDIDL